jgi:hypothetical protein
MNIADLRDWLIPVATLIALIPTSIGVWSSLKEYRLKLRAETRLAESARAETDIRLLQLFTELLYIASGRKGEAVYSREILDLLVQKNLLTDEDFESVDNLKSKISQAALIAQTPGELSANAAFASIATLAKRHPILVEPALEALESSLTWNPKLSKKYIETIKEHA